MGRKRKYIPHLAEFYFQPKYNWNHPDCLRMYSNTQQEFYDTIEYRDCVLGMQDMGPESVDCIVADPPFGINFSGTEAIYNRDSKNVIEGYVEIDDYNSFSENWIAELPRIMKPTASAFIISGWTNLDAILNALKKAQLEVINHIIWKYQFGPYASRKFVSSHYHILWVVKDPNRYFFHRITHYNLDVWDEIPRTYKANQKKNGTKLPEDLVKRMIDFTTRPGDLVFDPFMGNGTTAITAKINYRHFFGFEVNAKMMPILQANIDQAKVGSNYVPYADRLMNHEEMAQIDADYKKAYHIYLQEKKASSASKTI